MATPRSAFELVAVVAVLGVAVAATVTQVRKDSREKAQVRADLFAAITPVTVTNCEVTRIGTPHDGGYLACGNLLGKVQAGYSYGIAGTDTWGCQISQQLHIPMHEYDCFDLELPPPCGGGQTVFHPECIGPQRTTIDGRPYDTFLGHFTRNGDLGKRLVVKSDVEGAEWDSFLASPDEVFANIDQLTVEFHQVSDARYVRAIERLKQFFVIAHVHFNNYSCEAGIEPFPAWAFEALLVSKRLAHTDGTPAAPAPWPLDAPNSAERPDCQR
jgi:hypothetical protein